MRATKTIGMLALALALASVGCGEPEHEKETMKVEDTVFGDLIGTQDKARDRTNAAMEAHRAALESQLEADEGAPPEE
ncbi:MAG TPA: hypothetical protein VML92_08260 [Steroidobacteraceae bacterium]|nr:hypothetical protein [Steroidobacteraceae bacterium]